MAQDSKKFYNSIRIVPKAGPTLNEQGDIGFDTSDDKLKVRGSGATRSLVNEDQAQSLTNKTIDADQNTISNIDDGNIKAGAAIDASKLADGSVSNTEFQYLDGVTSPIQDQLDGKASNALNENHIFVGDATNEAAAVDTDALGDIAASTAGGLEIKAGAIVNADINASAAIELSKLEALTASRALQSDGSGEISVSAVTSTELGYVSGVTSAIQTQLNDKASTELDNLGITAINADLDPAADNTIDLGNNGARFKDAYLAGDLHVSEIRATTTGNLVVDVLNAEVRTTTGAASVDADARQLHNGSAVVLDYSGSDLSVNTRKITQVVDPTSDQDAATKKYVDDGLALKANDADVIKKDGSVAFTGDQSMGGNQLTNLGAPSASTDAATKQYVDNVAEGLKPKAAVRVATTTAGTLATSFENGDTIDGVTLATGDRLLLKDQAAPAENGIYIVQASGAPVRSTDFDSLSPIDEINGAIVAVQEGTANAGKIFVQTGVVTTIGVSDINFVFFNSSSSIVGADGITVSGNNVSVDHDGEGLTFVATQLALELDGSTLSKSSSGLKVADAGVTATQLNTSVAGDGIAGGGGTALSVDHDGQGLQFTANQLALELDGSTLSKSASGLKVADNTFLLKATGDINETSFAGANNVSSPANVTGLAFANGSVRSFKAHVSVALDATADLFETFELNGVQRGADWSMSQESTGDTSGVLFSITSGGQVQYTSANSAGFVSLAMRFRATTTSL